MLGEESSGAIKERTEKDKAEIDPSNYDYNFSVEKEDGVVSLKISLDSGDGTARIQGKLDTRGGLDVDLFRLDQGDFFIQAVKVKGEKIEKEGFSTELMKQLIGEIKNNQKFKQAETLVGWVQHVAPIVNRAKLFGLDNLKFYEKNWSKDELELVDMGDEIYDSIEDIKNESGYISYVVKVDLDDLKENWQEID